MRAFDTEYKLHRLMLLRSPFFEGLIRDAWNSNGKMDFDMDLSHDENMSKGEFDLALKFIYGLGLTLSEIRGYSFDLPALANYLDLPLLMKEVL